MIHSRDMELTPRQSKTIQKLYHQKGGAVWWRVGTGKTRITFAWFATVAKLCRVQPRFIVVCRRAAFDDWREEMGKCGLKWRTREVEREEDLYSIRTQKPIVYLISHGMLAKLLDPLKKLSSRVVAVAYDEGFLYKNPSTHHCFAANRLSAMVGPAAILSGSVMTARDLTDVFGQCFAINKHQAIARTLTEFRSRYMFKFEIAPGKTQAAKFVAQKGAGERLSRAISPISSYHFPANDQREIVTQIKTIPATKEQLRCFHELKEYFELELRGSRMELKNAPSIITKCQQISDGFVKMEGKTLSVPSLKLDSLISQVQELISCGEKVVIWCAFKHSVDLILQRLQKLKLHAYGMTGSISFNLIGWLKDGQVAVCTVASGSSVNHFRNCAYAIYYSHSFHWLHMQQSRGRTNRHDSKHQTCFYYYLQVKGSLDTLVYQTVTSSAVKEKELIEQGVNAWLKQ